MSKPNLNVQTGVNVGGATNTGVLKGLIDKKPKVDAGSKTGNTAAKQFQKATADNDWSQMKTQADAANMQQHMNSSQKQSEAKVNAANDAGKMYGDYQDRSAKTALTNADRQAANISFAYGQQANQIRRMMNVRRNNP
jgi:hypothetical protein